MTDVNEEIVKAYYEQKGYVVKTNHYYAKFKKKENGRNVGGPADIDLLIIHPITMDRAMVQVKGWHNDVVRESNIEKKWITKDEMKLQMDAQGIEVTKKFFGTDKFRKILVLSCFEEKSIDESKKKLRDFFHYDEILDFPYIIKELIEGEDKINIFRNYRDSEFLQTLRLFIKYYIKRKDKREKFKI